jgi:hypothetical protein
MRRLLIATAALALMGAGTAMAQPTPSAAPAATPPIPDTPAAPAATPDATAQAPTMPAAGTIVVGDMSATNPPPAAGSYPPCKHKGQDRCVVTAQLKHHATTRSGT